MDKLIRLYKTHDLDLICLKADPSFQFNKKFKQAICAYVRGEEFVIEIPPLQNGYSFKYLNTAFHLKFSEHTEMDVINFLNSLRNGNGTGAMKAIFRSYFKGFRLEPFLYTVSNVKRINNCPIMTIYKSSEDFDNANDSKNEELIQEKTEQHKPEKKGNDASKEMKKSSQKNPVNKVQESQAIHEPETIDIVKNDINQNKEQNEEFDFFSALDKMMMG